MFKPRYVLLCASALAVACSPPRSSAELEADLRQLQESDHIYIGFVEAEKQIVNWIPMDGKTSGGTRKLTLTGGALTRITAHKHPRSFFDKGTEPVTSPNGKWKIRQQGKDLVVEEVGPGTVRIIAPMNRVLGNVHWSPDSRFLMYVERASRWNPIAIRALDNIVYVTVYRCRDGQKAYLKWFGEGAAAAPWEWLQIPPELMRNQ